jgi:acetyltransferase-like isoleucine patch superfamily enzyme
LLDPDRHEAPRDIHIGAGCWIGMNAVILPGVELDEHTVVGAGTVVMQLPTRLVRAGRCAGAIDM